MSTSEREGRGEGSLPWTLDDWAKAQEAWIKEQAPKWAKWRREWIAAALEAEARRGREDHSPPLAELSAYQNWQKALDAQRARILAEGQGHPGQEIVEKFLAWAQEAGLKKLTPKGLQMWFTRSNPSTWTRGSPLEARALEDWIEDLGKIGNWGKNELQELLDTCSRVRERPKVPKDPGTQGKPWKTLLRASKDRRARNKVQAIDQRRQG